MVALLHPAGRQKVAGSAAAAAAAPLVRGVIVAGCVPTPRTDHHVTAAGALAGTMPGLTGAAVVAAAAQQTAQLVVVEMLLLLMVVSSLMLS